MRSGMRVTLLFTLFYLSTIVSARPGYERFARGKPLDAQGGLLNFKETGHGEQMKEELLGAVKERHKRLSDQRRAELETRMALAHMMEKWATVSKGGRQLNMLKTGRRKRSIFEMNMKNLRKLFRLSGKLGYKGNPAYPVVS
ncbi:uncharacterized protein LOC143378924 [Andrena cerasifolii]|uniref:uncharacterized protein LOC143378924 n=1 Tax=Andrena cerasifolii TaxID=2819439 RepID=UPI0040384307